MVEEWNIDCFTVVQRSSNSGTEMTEGRNNDGGTVNSATEIVE